MDRSDEMLIQLALDYADYHDRFDASFVVSLKQSCEVHKSLTPKQRKALENIVDRWKMLEWEEENA
jgi:hypothetical protein